MLSFYSVKLNGLQMQIFNSVSKELAIREYTSYIPVNYMNLNLGELAVYSKTNQSALDELLKRISPRVGITVKKYCETYKIEKYFDLFQFGLEASMNIVDCYDISKGPFINFFTSSLKRALYFQVVKYLRDPVNEKSRVRTPEESDNEFYSKKLQVIDPDPTRVANYVDVYKYLSSLTKEERKITILFLKGFSFSEISRCSNFGISTISYKIKNILSKIAMQVKDCDYKYIGGRI